MQSLPAFVKQRDIEDIFRESTQNDSGIARNCYHKGKFSDMQIMLIAFAPNKHYDFIRDIHEGLMTFICLKGELKLTTKPEIDYDGQKSVLFKNEIAILKRKYWRATTSGDVGAVFLEVIEGKYSENLRQKLT